MIFYPTRKHISVDEYRAKSVDGEAWQLIDDLATRKRALLFLPGSWHFSAVGFLAAFPVGITVVFLLQTLFSSASVGLRGTLMIASIFTLLTVHGLFMLRVSLGLIYAQQDLVIYLRGLLSFTLGATVYGLITAASVTYILLPAISSVLVFVIIKIAQSVAFTLYSDLMRVKRIYMRAQKERSGR